MDLWGDIHPRPRSRPKVSQQVLLGLQKQSSELKEQWKEHQLPSQVFRWYNQEKLNKVKITKPSNNQQRNSIKSQWQRQQESICREYRYLQGHQPKQQKGRPKTSTKTKPNDRMPQLHTSNPKNSNCKWTMKIALQNLKAQFPTQIWIKVAFQTRDQDHDLQQWQMH